MNYITTVRYAQTQDDGLTKTVTEQYLIHSAANFADAENLAYKQAAGAGADGIEDVTAIKRTNICDIIHPSDDRSEAEGQRWYKAKLALITLDEKTGKERKTAVNHIVLARDIADARNIIVAYMRGSVTDYEIATLDETKIVSVISASSHDGDAER